MIKKKDNISNKRASREEVYRLVVVRSGKHTVAQLVEQEAGRVIATIVEKNGDGGTKTERARKIGQLAAKKALDKGIKKVVFDRHGQPYHGRVRAVAEGAREGGLTL